MEEQKALYTGNWQKEYAPGPWFHKKSIQQEQSAASTQAAASRRSATLPNPPQSHRYPPRTRRQGEEGAPTPQSANTSLRGNSCCVQREDVRAHTPPHNYLETAPGVSWWRSFDGNLVGSGCVGNRIGIPRFLHLYLSCSMGSAPPGIPCIGWVRKVREVGLGWVLGGCIPPRMVPPSLLLLSLSLAMRSMPTSLPLPLPAR